jgi:hypothetical protein
MADKIALEFDLTADKAQMTLGELEKGFDEMKDRLKEVGRGSEEFKQLTTAMAQTTAEIKNIELGFEGLDREQVASELGSVAGGIGDITASLVLLGGENETIEQIGASIEKAMAISMGFKGAIEGLSSANKLYNNLLKQGKVALIAKTVAEKAAAAGTWLLNAANKALNITMKANPIGLLVTALGLAVAGIVYFKDAIWGLIKTALSPFQFAIDAVVDALQWLGIMESDSAIATRKAEEEKAKAAIESAEKRTEATEKLIKDHKKMTDSIVEDMDWEIRKRQANGDDTKEIEADKLQFLIESAKKQKELQQQKIKDLAAEEWARLKSGKFTLKGLKETAEGIKQALDEGIEATETVKELEREVTINQITENKKRRDDAKKAAEDKKKAAADQKKIDEKAAEDAIKLQKEKNQLLEDLEAKAIEDKNVRALAELELAQERERQQLIEKYGLDTELMLALEEEQLLQMNTLIEGIEQEARDKKAEIRQLELDAQKEADAKEIEDEKQKAADKQKIREQSLAASIQVIESISSLNEMALQNDLKNAGDNEKLKEKLRKASFEREKKLNIAMALVNGAQAQMSILAQTPKADFGIATAIAMAAAAVTTIAQIAAIKATSYQGGGSPAASESQNVSAGGAGAAGGGAAITPVSNTSTILGGQQVFVTETDITETQNNVSVIEESATF